jgi:hypothetical protein
MGTGHRPRPAGPGQPASAGRPVRVGVVVPVHDEERLLDGALRALVRAAAHASRVVVECRIVVVLDDCTDHSAKVAERWRRRSPTGSSTPAIEVLEVRASCVGVARSAGCAHLLRTWSGVPTGSIWLATTDGDSRVPVDWISGQVAMFEQGVDVWAGTVTVADWAERLEGTAAAWAGEYRQEVFPVHGANLGCAGPTYLRVGGFRPVPTGEDRALVERAQAVGAVVRHHSYLRVATSGRRVARAPRGFAHALTRIEDEVSQTTAPLTGTVAG